MQNLMDMFMQGGQGNILAQLARQYSLPQDQAQNAVEALMPAFSQAFKRNTADPAGFLKMMAALSSGKHAAYFDDPGNAFSGSGMADGNAILGHLFGSKDVSRAVAAQASAMTGISQTILKSLLPALAPIILGGLFKQMMGGGNTTQRSGPASSGADNPLGRILEQMAGGSRSQPTGSGTGGAANPWGKILEEMLGGGSPGTGQTRSPRQEAPSGGGNPWGRILEEMMGGQTRQSPQGSGRQADNPLGDIFDQMMRGGQKAGRSEPQREQHDEPERDAEPRRNPGDIFGDMFETGRKVQKDYQRNVESIFDEYLGGMKRR
ncbi:MAG: DUF937 domain-containing protein [Rhizobiaceae bacterium]